MRVSGAIRHTVGAYIVRKMVAAAVSYCAITAGEFWKVFCPHPVVLKAAVNKYDRFALSDVYIGNFGAVGGNPLDVIGLGHRAHRAAHDESSDGYPRKVASRHAGYHVGFLLLSWV
jgi:hypothetical protein